LTQLHGLATTGDQIMRALNWRSVDSSACILNAAKFAVIFVAYDDRMRRIAIGRRKSRSHFDYEDERLRAQIVQMAAEHGFDLDELRDDPAARQLFNLRTVAEPSRRGHESKRHD
jgi:hypothetical protein